MGIPVHLLALQGAQDSVVEDNSFIGVGGGADFAIGDTEPDNLNNFSHIYPGTI